ncbi:MAG: Hsp20/alpha crystallin family protein [Lentisphaerae bacterium]|nr:Hsp20/alpha crystallin family protein [Lentisphaerota bacterium]
MFDLTQVQRDPWSIFDGLESLQEDFNQALSGWGRQAPWYRRRMAFPPLNVWSSNDGVVIDAELPGTDTKDVDISVTGSELTLRGRLGDETPREGETVHRRERATGEFVRTLQLPFRANAADVTAAYKNGILRITVPRAEEDKPHKIFIEAG